MKTTNFVNFCNIFYPPTEEAKKYYDSREDLHLQFINGGSSLMPTTDKWTLDHTVADNIGDNVSYLNPFINEWSSLYWIRTHLDLFKEFDYIGHCHYRLMFNKMPDCIDKDIYVSKSIPMKFFVNNKILDTDIDGGWKACHIPLVLDVVLALLVLKGLVKPDVIMKWKSQKHLNAPCMTFMMKRDLFIDMFNFCWPLVEYFAKNLDLSGYDNYQKRQAAFIGERLFSLWAFNKEQQGHSIEQLDTIKQADFKPITAKDNRGQFI